MAQSLGMQQALSPEKLKLVLRRAAELERKAERRGEEVDLDVREIADEVGIAPEAVERALAEMHAGVLARAAPKESVLDQVLGPAEVVVERVVDAPPEVVRQKVEAFLAQQLLRVARRFGDRIVWRAQDNVWSRVRRAVDFTERYELPRRIGVDSVVLAEGEGKTLVRFTIRLDRPRRRRAWGTVAGAAVGAVVAAAGIAAADPAVWDAIFAASGVGIGGVTLLAMRRRQWNDVEAAKEALERFLDHVA